MNTGTKDGVLGMDEDGFQRFLKRGGRKPHTVSNVVSIVRAYEAYLGKFRKGLSIDRATPDDLEAYTQWYEVEEGESAKRELWGIQYYYRFIDNKVMARRTSELREARTQKTRKAFRLKEFRGVNPEVIGKLEECGIRDVEQMRNRGRTLNQRVILAEESVVPVESILELVKLSDLARLPGVRGIRARLYYDAGVDTLEKMAQWDPEELRIMLIDFVEKTGFDGIAPLPKEAASSVKVAQELPKLIEF